MKKMSTKIMLLAGILSLLACSKEDTLEPNLLGVYKYKSAHIEKYIKIGENTYTSDLIFMKGTECVFDNIWEFKAEKLILREGETSCENDSLKISKNELIGEYKYNYDKENGTIKIFYNSGLTETLRNVKLGYDNNNKQTLSFDLWSDTADQVVNYYLEEK